MWSENSNKIEITKKKNRAHFKALEFEQIREDEK